jgi:hypothetical protein
MSQTCPTVAVKADNDDGYMIINKSDLTSGHTIIGGDAPTPKPKTKGKGKSKDDLTDPE